MGNYNVTTTHKEYDEYYQVWELCEDAYKGEMAIKEGEKNYLPMPNPLDVSEQNLERYKQYLFRAVYYNATGRTVDGLIGSAFRKPPILKVPSPMDYVNEDVDGMGVGIIQQSQMALLNVLLSGRCGLLVDYPALEEDASAAQGITANVLLYKAESIVNWAVSKVGNSYKLSLVVIKECVKAESDSVFGADEIEQYRVLLLQGGQYIVQIWREVKGEDNQKKWSIVDAFTPKMGNGQFWSEIPFCFIGSKNNDCSVDKSPVYDLASLNIAHYRNSADYEDSAYIVGQPQAWIGGLTKEWYEMLKEDGVYIGSRSALMLPENSNFAFAQVQPNTMIREAMDAKEKQMISLGARLIQQGSAAKTATQAQGEIDSEMSVLSLCVSNVSAAYKKALNFAAIFNNVSGEIDYTINKDFIESKIEPQLLMGLIQLWQSGKYPESDLWAKLREYGLIDEMKTDDQIKEEIDSNPSGIGLNG